MELFLYGNPRLLAGCGGHDAESSRTSYENAPHTVSTYHTTEYSEKKLQMNRGDAGSVARAKWLGENIHYGKGSYHDTPAYNRFLVEGQWPSAGIELETIASQYTSSFADSLKKDLESNWFHFERDGSLDGDHSGTYGFELITEPLPPRVYRDPQTWIALENLVSPWLESFDHGDTGLHVHVGLNQFAACDAIPLTGAKSRMFVGKAMAILVYYAIADRSFIDRVVLRKNTSYCQLPDNRQLFEGLEDLSSGKLNGHEFIDLTVGKLVREYWDGWSNAAGSVMNAMSGSSPDPDRLQFCRNKLSGTTGHGAEVNSDHLYTLEFRRPKGTLHALSIHRIVELMTMIVRYAGKCCMKPDEKVSREAFYAFIHDNTTSEALKNLVEKATK